MSRQNTSASEAMVRKLERLTALDDADRAALRALPFKSEKLRRSHHLVQEGNEITECCILVRGYAMRHKIDGNGGRQIVSFHVAGDLLDLQHLLFSRADHNIETITEAEVGWVPAGDLRQLAKDRPSIGEAFWRDTLIGGAIFREWVQNVGRREARPRIAHMLCEFATRCEAAGLGRREQTEMPMTQEQIGDATGLTAVHVNRTLKALRMEGLLRRHGRKIAVQDWDRLRSVADFDPAYLHAA